MDLRHKTLRVLGIQSGAGRGVVRNRPPARSRASNAGFAIGDDLAGVDTAYLHRGSDGAAQDDTQLVEFVDCQGFAAPRR